MNDDTPPPGSWQADLDGLFATLAKEDQAYLDNTARQTKFYHDTALPALQAAAAALHHHGRTAEAGQEATRTYLIVSQPTGEIEFQYAVVAEVRIEAVIPYIHCWFEENQLAEAQQQRQGQPEKPQGDDQKPDDDKKPDDGGGGEGGDQPNDKEPKRTKTMEVLGTWHEGRSLESVTQEEIMADFVQHYREALALARTQLHVAPPAPPQ